MHNKRLLLYIPILLVIVVGIFGMYEFKLQQLVNEGVSISNEQCKVFTSLQEQNKIFKQSIEVLLTPNSKETYLKQLDKYFKISKDNVSKQEKWLSAQKDFNNRLDYNLLPSNIQELGILRYQYWKLDNEAQSALIDSYNIYQINENLSDELGLKSQKLNKERDSIQKKINLIWNNYEGKPDWRMMFIKIPQSDC